MNRINLNTIYINDFTKIPTLKINKNFTLNEKNKHDDINIVVEFAKNNIENTLKYNCILWKSEPDNIYKLKKTYINKFGYLITNKKIKNIKTKNIIGLSFTCFQSWISNQELIPKKIDNPSSFKNKEISLITSNQMIFGTHPIRYNFVKYLQKNKIYFIDILGFDKKIKMEEGLLNYKYTIVLENTLEENHWTEKLNDALKMKCFIFYYGSKNIEKYFNMNSIIKIDIKNTKETIDIIKKTISNKSFENNLESIEDNYDRINKLNINDYLDNILRQNNIKDNPDIEHNYYIETSKNIRHKLFPSLSLKYKNTYVNIWKKMIKIIKMKLSNSYKNKIENNFNPEN